MPLTFSLLIPSAAFAHNGEVHSQPQSSQSAIQYSSTSTPAAELRIKLDTALTEHAFLAIETMRKGADGSKDFNQSAAALLANSDDIAAAVSSVYGKEGGDQFLKIWNSHITFFVDYVTAVNEGNQEDINKALANLENYKKEQAAFFDAATKGRLPAAAMEKGLTVHVNQLLAAFNAYVESDYQTAYKNERAAIHHMSMFAETLSIAIAAQFPELVKHTNPDTPAVDLRAHLNYLFTEHAALAVMAMQDGIDGSKNFEQSAAALMANADDLTAAVASVYGKKAGDQFSLIWKSHIAFFVDYVVATGQGNAEAQAKAKAELDEYIVEQAAFLDAATQSRVPASALEEGLKTHINQLLGAFNSYVAGDYEMAYASVRESYAHMTLPAAGLSAAVVEQFPGKFTVKRTPFTDVSARYEKAVSHLYNNGIARGLVKDKFGIGQPLKRVDAAVLVANSMKLEVNPESKETLMFKDVPQRAEAAVAALQKAGILKGKTTTAFGSSETMTRGEAALILSAAYKLPATAEQSAFTDVNERYSDAVNRLFASGAVSGKTDSRFGTNDQLTRGELALMIYQLETR